MFAETATLRKYATAEDLGIIMISILRDLVVDQHLKVIAIVSDNEKAQRNGNLKVIEEFPWMLETGIWLALLKFLSYCLC